MAAKLQLDVPAFYRTLDNHRQVLGHSWRRVARDTGVPHQTFSQISRGHAVALDNFLTLLGWVGWTDGLETIIIERGKD